MRAASLLLLLTLGLGGCGGPAEPVDPGIDSAAATGEGLEAAFVETGVQLRNGGSETRYYAVFAEGALALFAPCLTPRSCPRVEPGQSVVVPFARVTGWDRAASAAEVHHWTLRPTADGGHEAGALGSFIVAQD